MKQCEKIYLIVSATLIVMSLMSTAYFGWNWTPKSNPEAIIDCVLLITMGINIFIFAKDYNKEE